MFSPIEEILDELRAGRMIVMTDDEDRENEGDLVLAAQFATAERINFMIRQAGGYLFLSLTEADCDRLDLHWQSRVNTSVRGTPLTVTIDGHPKHGFTTGVAADERARTILMAIDPSSRPEDFVRPGHVNPLRSRDGGVLVRIGHTEGIVDLCRLAGLYPAAVGIETCRPDGSMARGPDLEQFCRQHGLKMCSIADLIRYRLARETLITRIPPVEGRRIETVEGPFTLIAYESIVDALPQLALTVGGVGVPDCHAHVHEQEDPILVRMHRRHLLGDIFGELSSSPEGPTSLALRASMRAMQEAGKGVLVYLRPEGLGVAEEDRLTAIRRGGKRDGDGVDFSIPGGLGSDALPMHHRAFGIGGQILRDLGVRRMRLLTNHPKSMPGLDAFGLEISEHVALRLTSDLGV